MTGYEEALAALRKTESRLLAIPGVTGVSVGYEQVGGEFTDRWALVVHVRDKLAPASVPAAERIPDEVDGVPVDVIEAGPAAPHALPADTDDH